MHCEILTMTKSFKLWIKIRRWKIMVMHIILFSKNKWNHWNQIKDTLREKWMDIVFFTFFFSFIYLILLYNIVLVLPYIDMNPPWMYMCSPSWTPLPPPFPSHPSGSSQHQPRAPCIMHVAIRFTCNNLHVSMPFSHIIPPSPSPTESKRLFYTSVSLLLSCIQGYLYHLSEFHIYALVYCIGVFLSGLFHSV